MYLLSRERPVAENNGLPCAAKKRGYHTYPPCMEFQFLGFQTFPIWMDFFAAWLKK